MFGHFETNYSYQFIIILKMFFMIFKLIGLPYLMCGCYVRPISFKFQTKVFGPNIDLYTCVPRLGNRSAPI